MQFLLTILQYFQHTIGLQGRDSISSLATSILHSSLRFVLFHPELPQPGRDPCVASRAGVTQGPVSPCPPSCCMFNTQSALKPLLPDGELHGLCTPNQPKPLKRVFQPGLRISPAPALPGAPHSGLAYLLASVSPTLQAGRDPGRVLTEKK